MTDRNECGVCGGEASEIEAYSTLPRVTSDCKPFPSGGRLLVCGQCGTVQKVRDEYWRVEIGKIYRDYQVYFQSGGVEQGVFGLDGSAGGTRSNTLVGKLFAEVQVADGADALDIGCGNGAFLKALGASRPDMELYGFELSARDQQALQSIPGFRYLYCGSLSRVDRRFDLVAMIHALEHFESPVDTVAVVSYFLESGGSLFIQVPNAGINPYDLLIADHAYHFTPGTLRRVLDSAGLYVRSIADDWVAKELSAITCRGDKRAVDCAATPGFAEGERTRILEAVRWLTETQARACEARGRGGTFGLFGSSISAMWLYGALDKEVDFFVDEDPSRKGALVDGRPIIPPADIQPGSTVFIPLLPAFAESVSRRFAALPVNWVPPPAMG